MKFSSIRKLDISNGEGCRVSVFTQGCDIHCQGCFNSELWDETKGKEWNGDTTDLLITLLSKDYIKGLSWLGGEPTIWASQIAAINKLIKQKMPDKTIWLYSGHTLEYLLGKTETRELLYTVDVLVDGPFIESKKDIHLPFRGSSNQRIWDVQKSLKENHWVEYQLT